MAVEFSWREIGALLAQERMDLEAELAASGEGGVDIGALEAAFIEAAGPYSQRKGITYDAWRRQGLSLGCSRGRGQ